MMVHVGLANIGSDKVIERAEKAWTQARQMPVSYTHLDVYKRQGNGIHLVMMNCRVDGSDTTAKAVDAKYD